MDAFKTHLLTLSKGRERLLAPMPTVLINHTQISHVITIFTNQIQCYINWLQKATLTIKFAAPCDFPEDKRKRVHIGLAVGLKVGAVHGFIEYFRRHVATRALASLVWRNVYFSRLAVTPAETTQQHQFNMHFMSISTICSRCVWRGNVIVMALE